MVGTHKSLVLVVDDNDINAKTTAWLIEAFGYQVETEANGKAAIEKAIQLAPAAIVMDIGMPGMSGFDTCKTMREIPQLKNTKIIALTGWCEPEHRTRSQEVGFDYHMIKPANLDMLEKILDDCCVKAA